MMSIALVVALLTPGSDWPAFRGPTLDGHAPGAAVPLEWSDTRNVVWSVELPGLGWSSPVVVGDRIFLTTAVKAGEGLSLRTMALAAGTGKVIWDREVKAVPKVPPIHKKNSHASPTPIVRDGKVYVHFGTLGTARLRAVDGTIDWLCEELVYPPLHGSGGTPALFGNRLGIVCDGSREPFVAALDADTGKVVWKTLRTVPARISHSFVTPTVTLVDGKPQLLAPGPDHFAAYDLMTGAEVWKSRAPGWSVVPQPVVGHGLVFYNRDYDDPELIAIRLGGKGDVTDSHVAWRLKKGSPSTPSPLLVGDELYVVNDAGIATCVDARTGEVRWVKRLGGNFSASPILNGDRILFLNETGRATWVKPGREYVELGRCQIEGQTLATPAFSGGSMYLRTDTRLLKIAH
jgi:outer membrane protein assembly factor BamB